MRLREDSPPRNYVAILAQAKIMGRDNGQSTQIIFAQAMLYWITVLGEVVMRLREDSPPRNYVAILAQAMLAQSILAQAMLESILAQGMLGMAFPFVVDEIMGRDNRQR